MGLGVTKVIVMNSDEDFDLWGELLEKEGGGDFLHLHLNMKRFSPRVQRKVERVIALWDLKLKQQNINEIYAVVHPEHSAYSRYMGLEFKGYYHNGYENLEVYRWPQEHFGRLQP